LRFEADLHRTYVSGVERGIRNPTVLIVAKLANALGVEPSKLLELND
jgi:transcriptional regulator with XRE-family HTH domain